MEYMLLIYMDESEAAGATPEKAEKHADAFAGFVKDLMAKGVVVKGGAPLQTQATATTVKVRDGKTLTTDGPFMETKEALAGFYHVEAADLDEAIQIAAMMPAFDSLSVEVRPVWSEMLEMVGRRLG